MIDGPAADQSFGCGRRPELLRVVRSPGGKWDCLDLLDDEPRPRERIYLYECLRRAAGYFMCVRGPGGGGGYHASGDYVFVIAPRPGTELDEICRDAGRWRGFVEAYFGVTIDWSDGRQVADVVPLRSEAPA